MSKQDSSFEIGSSQPMPSAPPSYDQSIYPDMVTQMPMPVQAKQVPPYQYQPLPVAHETPVYAPQQQQYIQNQAQLPVFNPNVPVGPQQIRTTCPHCQATVKSKVDTECAMGAHVCCFILCIFGCCLCSCIPYCMDSFKIVKHTCPNCKAYLGTYKP